MSLLSQFFPSGSTQGDYQFLLVGGGGFGGANSGPTTPGGRGGGGGLLEGFINLDPGVHPVVIGGGGSPSSFSNSTYIAVAGGQGGSSSDGLSGGSGGGGAEGPPSLGAGGESVYTNDITYINGGSYYSRGYPGGSVRLDPSPTVAGGAGGGAGGEGMAGNNKVFGGHGFFSTIQGPTLTGYAQGGPSPAAANTGNGGNPAPIAQSGGSGIFILSYPTVIGAATTFSGATDISPSTPGKRTYRFTSTGSITLP